MISVMFPISLSHFYPRSPCGERLLSYSEVIAEIRFLSTLSLRRATRGESGQRHLLGISIHALLAESDAPPSPPKARVLYFYPRSPCGERHFSGTAWVQEFPISIHALLAESDGRHISKARSKRIFLSTLSLRRATIFPPVDTSSVKISIHALLAESDLDFAFVMVSQLIKISIHALLAESDRYAGDCTATQTAYFYPRSPCGERLGENDHEY